MNIKSFLRAGSLAALAAALALPPVAAQAQENRGRGDRGAQVQRDAARTPPPAARAVAERVERVQRAARIDNRTEQRAARIERNGDRAARQAAQQGDFRQAQRIDRQSERTARQVEQRGDRRAAPVAQGQNWQQRSRNDGPRDQDRNDRNRDQNWRGNEARGSDWRRDDNRRAEVNRRGNDNWRRNDTSRYDNRTRDYREAQQRWDRNWRNNNRYDWNRYRQSNRNLYRPGRYYSPYSNYSYRRLSIGVSLNSLFFSSRYWINDPWQYRLPAAYGPYRWVRYYDDVLLVDTYTGQVVDVIYDFFW